MIRYGELRIHPLPEGRFTVGEDKRFIPHDPDRPLPAGTLFVSVTPFLIETPAAVLLLDTGLGPFAEGRDVTFLLDGIRAAGYEREDVTHILLSHLHVDHIGGAITTAGGFDQPTFPDAVYVVQTGEARTDAYHGRAREARDRMLHTLEHAGQLTLVEGDTHLTDEIELCHTGGHTPHHQAIRLHSGGRTAVFGGDVLPAPAQIKRSFRAKYDFDPAHAQAERARLAREAAEHGHLLLFYHSPDNPAAFVEETRQGFRIEAVGEPVGS